jgi:hypothetical protein
VAALRGGGIGTATAPGGARPEPAPGSAPEACRHRAGRRAAGAGNSAAAVTAPGRRAAGAGFGCGVSALSMTRFVTSSIKKSHFRQFLL